MSFLSEQHKAELEQFRRTKAYYDSIRRPWMERITFSFAFLASVGVTLHTFGISITQSELYGQWFVIFYWVAFIAFIGLDSIFAKAHHPVPIPFGGFNPSRMYEKFTMQKRVWQLALVLMLPVTARFIEAAIITCSPTHCSFR